ncbi:MAG: CPBP family intramembrane metalloprotease [Chlorobi bacterium]|nr:CPBP family intramembrane metalloprotease [Chlorobiota bacterium]
MNNNPMITPTEHTSQPSVSTRLERALNPALMMNYQREYLKLTTTLTYGFLFTLPLVLIYELGTWILHTGGISNIQNGADVMVKRVLEMVGLSGTLAVSALLLLIGGIIYLYERRHRYPIIPRYFGFMFGESAVYAVGIGLLVQTLLANLFTLNIPTLSASPTGPGFFEAIVLSFGAGYYEEFVFRLLLVTGLYGVLQWAKNVGDKTRYAIAAVVGGLIFSWIHYIGPLGDQFELWSFTFRFLMGLAFNALFLLRGFGVAAMTHALYDVWVMAL